MGFFSDFLDDVLGFDPPPKPPKPARAAPPTPTERTGDTGEITVGVDEARELRGSTTRTNRSLFFDEEQDYLGVGLNV